MLTPDDLQDIIKRRNEKGAARTLAKEYKCANARIYQIWEDAGIRYDKDARTYTCGDGIRVRGTDDVTDDDVSDTTAPTAITTATTLLPLPNPFATWIMTDSLKNHTDWSPVCMSNSSASPLPNSPDEEEETAEKENKAQKLSPILRSWPSKAHQVDLALLTEARVAEAKGIDMIRAKQFWGWKVCVEEFLAAEREQRAVNPKICDMTDLDVHIIPENDPRINLRGQYGVFARRKLLPGACYPYGGLMKRADEEMMSNHIDSKWKARFDKLSYTFPHPIQANGQDVHISGIAPYGNAASLVNDSRLDTKKCTKADRRRVNAIYGNPMYLGKSAAKQKPGGCEYDYEGPVSLLEICKSVEEGDEVLTFYGADYFATDDDDE